MYRTMKLLSNYHTPEIEVGCHVRVLRIAESHANGWDNTWISPNMDKSVGTVSKVLEILVNRNGIREMMLENNIGYCFYYPEFVLEIV